MTQVANNELLVGSHRRRKWWFFVLIAIAAIGAWFLISRFGEVTVAPPGAAPADATAIAAAPADVAATQVPTTTQGVASAALPVTPTLNLPAAGVAWAGVVEMAGTGEPGGQVQVTVNGESIGVAEVGDDGSWRASVELPAAGAVELTIDALNDAGEVVVSSAVQALVDGVLVTNGTGEDGAPGTAEAVPAPGTTLTASAPSINLPAIGVALAGSTELTGTGEPGSKVQIQVNGQPAGEAEVDASGNWTAKVEIPATGVVAVTVGGLDAEGKVTSSATPLTVQDGLVAESRSGGAPGVATPAATGTPAAGAGEGVTPTATAPSIKAPAAGTALAGPTELTGTGEPGGTVQVLINGQPAGEAEVDASGVWTATVEIPATGAALMTVGPLDADGKVTSSSAPVTVQDGIVVATPGAGAGEAGAGETVAPTAPSIKLPAPGAALAGPTELTGTGEPGSKVQVLINGQPAGEAEVDASGVWTATVEIPATGAAVMTAAAVDAEGTMTPSSATVAVQDGVVVDASTGATTTGTPAAGGGEAGAGESLTPTATAPNIKAPAAGAALAGPTELTGTGEPGSKIQVSVNGEQAGAAEVDASGVWTATVEIPATGAVAVTTATVDADGNATSSSSTLTVQDGVVVAVAPGATDIPAADEGEAGSTGVSNPALAVPTIVMPPAGSPLNGRVVLTGSGVPNDSMIVVINGAPSAPALVDAVGIWTATVTLPASGNVAVQVDVVDADGMVTAASVPLTVQDGIVTSVPAADGAESEVPATSTPEAGAEEPGATGEVTTTTPAPTISVPPGGALAGVAEMTGTGEAGRTVQITIDGVPAAEAEVDAGGVWTATVEIPGAGTATLGAGILDEDGNVASIGAPVTVEDGMAVMNPMQGGSQSEATATSTPVAESGSMPANPPADAAGETPAASAPAESAGVPAIATPSITLPVAGGPLAGTTVLTGRGTPEDQIAVVINGSPVTTTTVDAAGVWTATVTLPPMGTVLIQVVTIDADGKVISASEPLRIEDGVVTPRPETRPNSGPSASAPQQPANAAPEPTAETNSTPTPVMTPDSGNARAPESTGTVEATPAEGGAAATTPEGKTEKPAVTPVPANTTIPASATAVPAQSAEASSGEPAGSESLHGPASLPDLQAPPAFLPNTGMATAGGISIMVIVPLVVLGLVAAAVVRRRK
ncbi:MAG: hypothetical protein IPK16_31375 [Anaerolineales bacterium]|nr:hypothetical protein [Anaerolineales bacterium]